MEGKERGRKGGKEREGESDSVRESERDRATGWESESERERQTDYCWFTVINRCVLGVMINSEGQCVILGKTLRRRSNTRCSFPTSVPIFAKLFEYRAAQQLYS